MNLKGKRIMTRIKLAPGATIAGRISLTARRFAADSTGATAVEYGLVTLIAIAVMFGITQIGDNLAAIFERLQTALAN
jgi:Flp pilus assembly pilin Flp